MSFVCFFFGSCNAHLVFEIVFAYFTALQCSYHISSWSSVLSLSSTSLSVKIIILDVFFFIYCNAIFSISCISASSVFLSFICLNTSLTQPLHPYSTRCLYSRVCFVDFVFSVNSIRSLARIEWVFICCGLSSFAYFLVYIYRQERKKTLKGANNIKYEQWSIHSPHREKKYKFHVHL